MNTSLMFSVGPIIRIVNLHVINSYQICNVQYTRTHILYSVTFIVYL